MAQHDGVRGVRLDLAGDQVAGDDAGAAAVDHDGVDELDAVEQANAAEADLAGELLVGAEQQLLAGLTAGVERAADLGAAEGAVVEQAAVLAGEGHALGHHLIDDVDADLGEAVDVALPRAEVAALDGVVEQAMHRVAVAAVVLGGVDATLRGDRVGTPRRVVERERVDLVAELGERCGRRRAGQARADDDDLELALVVGVDQLHVVLVRCPTSLRWDRQAPRRIKRDRHAQAFTIPARTATGNDTLPTTISVAKPIAKPRRHLLNLGRFQPID